MAPPLCAWLSSGIVRLLADGVRRGVVKPSEIIASLGRAMDYGVIDRRLFHQLGIDVALFSQCQRENPKGPVCLYFEAGIVDLLARGVDSGVIDPGAVVSAISIGFRQGIISGSALRALGLDSKLLTSCESAPAPGPGVAHDLAAADSPFPGINTRHLKGLKG